MKKYLSAVFALLTLSLGSMTIAQAEETQNVDKWLKLRPGSISQCGIENRKFIVRAKNAGTLVEVSLEFNGYLFTEKAVKLSHQCNMALAQALDEDEDNQFVMVNARTGEVEPLNGFFIRVSNEWTRK